MSRAAAFCILLFMTACGGGATITRERISSIRTIGIVSAIGDRLQLRKVGLSAMQSDERSFPIESWGIDEYIVGKVRAQLSSRYDVRPVNYEKPAFAAPSANAGVAQLHSAASPQGLDAYILITKYGSRFADTNQAVNGLGIVNGAFGDYFTYALYGATLVDGHHLTVIDKDTVINRSAAPLSQEDFYKLIFGPYRRVDASFWPETLEQAQDGRLRAAIKDLVDQSLSTTIDKLNLAGRT